MHFDKKERLTIAISLFFIVRIIDQPTAGCQGQQPGRLYSLGKCFFIIDKKDALLNGLLIKSEQP
jgi:hypothetical protein